MFWSRRRDSVVLGLKKKRSSKKNKNKGVYLDKRKVKGPLLRLGKRKEKVFKRGSNIEGGRI